MTSKIFVDWLHKLDNKFKLQRQKVAMILVNSPSHPYVKNLKAMKLYFLLPNTTSETQPMDQGVIQNLKVHYRKHVVTARLKCQAEKKDSQVSILDALHFIKKAWSDVKPESIFNCFLHVVYNEKISVCK